MTAIAYRDGVMAERVAREYGVASGLIFKIVEPGSGRTYRIYADGRIEGFAADAWVANHFPLLARQVGREDPRSLTATDVGAPIVSDESVAKIPEEVERVERAIFEAIQKHGGIICTQIEWDAVPDEFRGGVLRMMAEYAIAARLSDG